MIDLVTGAFQGGTTTLAGTDENGPYVYSNDSAGTGAVSFPVLAGSMGWHTWGVIFKLAAGSGRGYAISLAANTGIAIFSQSINFYIGGGGWGTAVTGIAGHTYFAFTNNAVGTASLTKTGILIDLVNGQTWVMRASATGNFGITPIAACSLLGTFIINTRVYAIFASASAGPVPPALQPAPTFYSIDQIMNAIKDPWGLWYA